MWYSFKYNGDSHTNARWDQFSDKGYFIVSTGLRKKACQVPANRDNYTNKIMTIKQIQMLGFYKYLLLVGGLVYSLPNPQKLGHSSGSFNDDDHSHNIMR